MFAYFLCIAFLCDHVSYEIACLFIVIYIFMFERHCLHAMGDFLKILKFTYLNLREV